MSESPSSEQGTQSPRSDPTVSTQPEQPSAAGPQTAPQAQQAPKLPVPWITYTLIGFCVLAYIGQTISELVLGVDLPFFFLGKINSFILQGQLWRLITAAFLHGSIPHILFNMYALYVLGTRIERLYGHARFGLIYFLAALGGNVLSFVLSKTPSLGASTALFGLLAANVVFIIQNRFLFGEEYKRIMLNLGVILLINLSIGLMPGSNIDNFGHLGGLLAGYFYASLGGPKFEVLHQGAWTQLRDIHTKKDHFLAGMIVFLAFAVTAAIPFFIQK